jgi:hypothetical protein
MHERDFTNVSYIQGIAVSHSCGYVIVVYVSRSAIKGSLRISVKWAFSLQDRSPLPRFESTCIEAQILMTL